MISVIIPTRNRSDLLKESISAILTNRIDFNKIVIIDSSDDINFQNLEYLHNKIIHLRTKIKSAAIQRNIGIEALDTNQKYVAFLDDDILVPNNYFSELIKTIENTDCVGVSGLALNPQDSSVKTVSEKLQIMLAKLFLLNSSREGAVLKSGVNIPVSRNRKHSIEVEWLIGCAVWDFSKTINLRFREDFHGQSLGEDVIYSHNARKFGALYVNPAVILTHFESSIMRPSEEEFMYMWIKNRYEIIKERQIKLGSLLAYHWSNFGKVLQIIFLKKSVKLNSLRGVLRGYKEIFSQLK
jgi:glycosyltransferase involved in cell wall biosynthesis